MIEWIHPDELKNHPTNLSIYGDTPDPELVTSVKSHGVFEDHPIGYVQDGDFKRIVSGHRRNQAARIAKLESVPIVRLKDLEGDPLAIEERIILSNKQRMKTNEQMAREAAKLADIEAARAEARQQASLKQNHQKTPENTVGTKNPDGGRVREKVAESLGIGDGKARDLIKAGKALESAEKKGQTKKVAAIKEGLSQSAKAGAKASEPKPPKDDSVVPPRKPGNAGSLLAKITADFLRAAENMAPLVRAWDSIKASDPSFHKKHQELLGHHSRLFQICEEGKRIIKKLNEVWGK